MNSSPLELVKQKFVKDINRIFKCYPIILRYPWGIVSRIPSVTENLVAFTYNLHTSSHISSVQFSRSVMSDSAIPWNAARQASLSFTNSQSLLKLMSINYVMPPNHLILCCRLLLQPSIFPMSIRVFFSESVLRIRWPKYWSFSFSISPSNEYSGLISFRMDWLDPVQGTCSPRDSQESFPTP